MKLKKGSENLSVKSTNTAVTVSLFFHNAAMPWI